MRVAVLGAGRMGSFHARTLSELPEVSGLAVFDLDGARAQALAAPLRADVAESLDAALAGAGAAVVATSTPAHAALVNRCMAAGIPCFCEKPLAASLAETRELVERGARESATVQVGFQRRFDEGYREARRLIRSGSLGRLLSFAMVSRDAAPPPLDYMASSGGIFRDLHIHDFDILRWLFGQEVELLFAISTAGATGMGAYETLDDAAVSGIVLRLEDGTVGILSGARENHGGYDIRVEVFGSRDTIAVGLDQRSPLRSVEAGGPVLPGPAYADFLDRFGDAYRAELAGFLRLCRGEAENACPPSEGLAAFRLAEAADLSWRERRPVRLDEIG